jgi:hypothetical protein
MYWSEAKSAEKFIIMIIKNELICEEKIDMFYKIINVSMQE